eukprot:11654893-Heterocapsa_arctica.AAC.1
MASWSSQCPFCTKQKWFEGATRWGVLNRTHQHVESAHQASHPNQTALDVMVRELSLKHHGVPHTAEEAARAAVGECDAPLRGWGSLSWLASPTPAHPAAWQQRALDDAPPPPPPMPADGLLPQIAVPPQPMRPCPLPAMPA